MTNLENLKKLAENLGADASGAETNAAAIGVIAEASKKIAEKIDLSGFGKMTKLAEDVSTSFPSGNDPAVTIDLTNVGTLTFTLTIAFTSGTEGGRTAQLYNSTTGKSLSIGETVNADNTTTNVTYDVSELTGNWKLSAVGGGMSYYTTTISSICGFAPIPVDNVVDALNYLLSLHD